ncbi:AAA family ATPase [Cognatiyoonia sp. IB215182]|uniref:bifunctional aminoglycoside phosphotransferase/ATP-binding protein n=1 Tax=Cognatiyoonia sp. IB215182 TaxID=3097353 RepID=UPI002A0DEABA|nr:AAA family ATPase [Cognatiyoonia sp. IB215182]MDX8354961.1 AAA family ATPase [Cognatiyoonia sp. IB215182]
MATDQTDQTEAIAFLRAHDSAGPAKASEVIQTHCALVFLHGTEALKIKRAVKYDYLDFSTLALREDMLRREMALNADAAPGLYHDVAALTRQPDGGIAFGGDGEIVEWVLRMTRFPKSAELSSMAKAGEIDTQLSEALGEAIARYHASAERRPEDGRALIAEIIAELDRVMSDMHAQLGPERIKAFLQGSRAALDRADALLRRRSELGFVRRCHGDLHLRNIIMWQGVPTPFDALEFDERLGTCDVLYDLAFLLMDLSHQHLNAQANGVLNAYLFNSGAEEHYAGLAALPLYLAIRAGIRAMVDVQTAAVQDYPADLVADARLFLDQANAFLTPAPPRLVAIGGLSGSGKTTVARALAPDIGAFPGAVHLRSDLERKAHFGVPIIEKLPASAYRPEVSEKIYDIMIAKARRTLAAGHSVILDAVYAKPAERDAVAAFAGAVGCPFHGLWLDAATPLRVERVGARGPDASDADAAIARQQDALQLGEIDWLRLDAGKRVSDLLMAIRQSLGLNNLERPDQGNHDQQDAE